MSRLLSIFSLALACTAATLPLTEPGLTVHEWGTFTSLAGETGEAVNWLPLDGPADLPCFVNRFPGLSPKARLSGTVRMETPVLYFYSPREMSVNVGVGFPHGLITEWYPPARVSPTAPVFDLASQASAIEWQQIHVSPGPDPEYPVEGGRSHYYAARQTDAAPLRAGGRSEKFLFYRGVGSFQPPLFVTETDDGGIAVKNPGSVAIPALILFENRAGKSGYRIQASVSSGTVLAAAQLQSDSGSLGLNMEQILVSQGLYAKEAKAMVETWSDSWFGEGTRVFYILPSRSVDSILPLRIDPSPDRVARVFVGRIEVLTRATQRAVQTAIEANDTALLAKYGRFLEPVLNRLRSSGATLDAARVNALLRNFPVANLSGPSGCAN